MRPKGLELVEPIEVDDGRMLELLGDGVLSVGAASAFASLSRATLYEAMQRGELVYIKRGRRRLIPRRALVRWLAEGLQN